MLAASCLGALPVAATAQPGPAPEATSTTSTAPEGSTSTTADPDGSTTSTTAPPGSTSSTTTTAAPAATTTTTTPPVTAPGVTDVVPGGFLTPEDAALYEALDGAGDARDGFYAAQPAFDPLLHGGVLDEELAGARRHLAAAVDAQDLVGSRQRDVEAALADVRAQVDALGVARGARVRDAADRRAELRARAAEAYIRGGGGLGAAAVTGADSAAEAAGRVALLDAVLSADVAAVREADAARAALDGDGQALADRLVVAEAAVASAEDDVALAAWDRLAAESVVAMYEAGSHVAVAGFVFPVVGDVGFIDSFGAPRNVGTSYEHWHEGTDVMAPAGTPVVAVEDGVVTRARPNRLGGNAIRLTGASGHGYYYAHLAAYAPGVVAGLPVQAGQLLGWVGDTGDAKGGAPHLHFEVHRPGSDEAVNPFPLLRVAWEALAAAGGPVAPPTWAPPDGVVVAASTVPGG